ncbi:MAG TPA: hypothetical protein DCY20_06320 [Firmicutes bacterium]|nr:hypothetical protein [Bacillota bacterium]
MLAEFQTHEATYVITDTKIYQSFPQVILYFKEMTQIKNHEYESGCGGELTIYGNNKVISIFYNANQVVLIKQLIKEIKRQKE